MEKRNIRTERGNINRQVQLNNKMLRQLRARIGHLKDWLAKAESAEPTLQDVFSELLAGRGDKQRWEKIADLKTAATTLVFLQENGIIELPQLRELVTGMYDQQQDINDRLKKTKRRLKSLDEHLRQAEHYGKRSITASTGRSISSTSR